MKADGRGCSVAVFLAVLVTIGLVPVAGADTVTFSGTIAYPGPYQGDTLYVAVLDTTGGEDGDVSFLDLAQYPVTGPGFAQSYTLSFDNTGAPAVVFVAALLDVDGGGVYDGLSDVDILGWYAGTTEPAGIAPDASQSGLDFPLPTAEIHGAVTLAPGQADAWVEATYDAACDGSGGIGDTNARVFASGPYTIRGIYPGTYCVFGEGMVPNAWGGKICHGDPHCATPTLIVLGTSTIATGVDLDFNALLAPVRQTTWGVLKTLYP
jgi:hypothetical protein